jgi:hypothetical protein
MWKKFKKVLVLCVLGMMQQCLGYGGDQVTSKTFFSVRPPFQSASPEKVSLFQNNIVNNIDNKYGGSLQLVVFGGESCNRDDLARYFMPFGKTTLVVKKQGKDEVPLVTPYADIIATNFNVITVNDNFESRISFNPKMKIFGIGLNYYQRFFRFCWAEISAPITYVDTSVGLREDVLNDGGGAKATPVGVDTFVTNMAEAFKQTAWQYGKIDGTNDMDKWGIADIELKVGLQKTKDDHYYSGYIGMLIPTGNKAKAVYIFEPIVGNNKHFGFLTGGSGGFDLWKNRKGNKKLQCSMHWHVQYLFSNTQKRSFDLCDKPWSRYFALYRDFAQAEQANLAVGDAETYLSTPGINILTRDVKVKPRFSCNINKSLEFTIKSFLAEIGYNLYLRQSEDITLKHDWELGPAIKHADGDGDLNPFKQMNMNGVNAEITYDDEATYNRWRILESDLDMTSASHPSVISHTIYGSMGYYIKQHKNPMMVGFGGSYEFGEDNVVLGRWTLWGKFLVSF